MAGDCERIIPGAHLAPLPPARLAGNGCPAAIASDTGYGEPASATSFVADWVKSVSQRGLATLPHVRG